MATYNFKGSNIFKPDKTYIFPNKCTVKLKNGTILENVQIFNQDGSNKVTENTLLNSGDKLTWTPYLKLIKEPPTINLTIIFEPNNLQYNYWELSNLKIYVNNILKTTVNLNNYNSNKDRITLNNIKVGSVISFKASNFSVSNYNLNNTSNYYFTSDISINEFTVNNETEIVIINYNNLIEYEEPEETQYTCFLDVIISSDASITVNYPDGYERKYTSTVKNIPVYFTNNNYYLYWYAELNDENEYEFSGNDKTSDNFILSAGNKYTITSPNTIEKQPEPTIPVNPIKAYTLIIYAGEGVTNVSPTEGITHTYYEGDTVEISAEAEAGYELDGNYPYNIIIVKNNTITITATKLVKPKLTYTLTVIAGEGVKSTSGSGTYEAGDIVEISAEAEAGYKLNNFDTPITMPNKNYTITITATAIPKPKLTYTLTVIAGDGVKSTSGSGTYEAGDIVEISAEAEAGYKLNNFDTPITMPNKNYTITITATKIEKPKYALLVTKGTGVKSVEPYGFNSYEAGTEVTITAEAETDYELDGSYPMKIVMNSANNIQVTATKVYYYLTVTAAEGVASVFPRNKKCRVGETVYISGTTNDGRQIGPISFVMPDEDTEYILFPYNNS